MSAMNHYTWTNTFLELFDRCLAKYRAGDANFSAYYSTQDLSFLASIGYKEREFFDFVEDFGDGAEPSREDALLIAAVRRDYFLEIQEGKASGKEMKPDELPGRNSQLEGFSWLPRIIQKAENKLRGENDPDIMYCCGGDRRFLRAHQIHPADFLRHVWAAAGDYSKVLAFVKELSPTGPDV